MEKQPDVVDTVIGTLRREGGQLTVSELSDKTTLPSGVLSDVVKQLSDAHVIRMRQEESTGLELVELTRKWFFW